MELLGHPALGLDSQFLLRPNSLLIRLALTQSSCRSYRSASQRLGMTISYELRYRGRSLSAKPGREQKLLQLVRSRVPTLRKEGVVADRVPTVMRSRDGTLIEVSEWKSR